TWHGKEHCSAFQSSLSFGQPCNIFGRQGAVDDPEIVDAAGEIIARLTGGAPIGEQGDTNYPMRSDPTVLLQRNGGDVGMVRNYDMKRMTGTTPLSACEISIMKHLLATVTLLFAAGSAIGADKPLVVELWPGKVPDETPGTIGPEKVVMSPKHDRKQVEVT